MAILNASQALDILKNPRQTQNLAKARRLEERLKLHTEAVMDAAEMQARFSFFREWVSGILPGDKMQGFVTLWQAPVETNELTESIFGELSRVFEAENPFVRHNFRDSETAADFIQYLASINDERFWKVDYWDEIKADQNSFIIVDLPEEQVLGQNPEPYYFLLDVDYVHDAVVNKNGLLEYIIYWTSAPGIIIVLDDAEYKTYEVPVDVQGNYDVSKAVLIKVVPHGLGRVPGKPVYFQPISKECTLVNHNPITRSLGALDWLLFFEVSKKYLETYAPFPIYATYSELSDNESETASNGENDLTTGVEHVLAPGERIAATRDHRNRNDANRKLIGPGTIQRYDAPKDSNDSDLLSNPVQVIPAEEVSLNYCDKNVNQLNDEIFANCVGKGGDVLNNQSANELQVQSTFESRINVLTKIKQRIEECRKYVYEVVAEMRYGSIYLGTDVSLGDQYYLTTAAAQQEEFKAAKEAGLPVYELNNQLEALYRNKYRDQPEILNRNQILAHLEPYPGHTVKEIADLVSKGLADKTKFQIKLQFDALIRRFEREQMNIVDFASARPLQTKVSIIQEKLKAYANEDNSSEQEREPGSQGSGSPSPRPLPGTGGEGAMDEGDED